MTTSDDLLAAVLGDLALEGLELREIVAGLDESGWRTPTPATGWDIATQVAHLAWTDDAAVAAITDEEAWAEIAAEAAADPDGFVHTGATTLATMPPTDLLAMWDEGRGELAEALRGVGPGERITWFGPPMSPASMATARFMETWAHGLDVREALGLDYAPTDRIRHVCHLGVRTRDFAFRGRELPPPAEEFRVELTAPSGAAWCWGPEDARQRVTGPAYDFARLVTQRIHPHDTGLHAVGADAERWLTVAQAFAGPPGDGRPARG